MKESNKHLSNKRKFFGKSLTMINNTKTLNPVQLFPPILPMLRPFVISPTKADSF